MAYMTDETSTHKHTADPNSKCKKCLELVKSKRFTSPASTIPRGEEPLSKGGTNVSTDAI